MTEDDLLHAGWVLDPDMTQVYRWRHPHNMLAWYTFRDAVWIQQHDDARVLAKYIEARSAAAGWVQ